MLLVFKSFIDGADPLDMQEYLQTQLTTEILVELAQSTSKFIGIKDHQIPHWLYESQ